MTDLLQRLQLALADRYTIERELGRGGMAVVYLAHDLKHHRQVAVKVLRPELAATLGPERFLREIEVAARLTHPHILPLHDSGEANGFLYYVMPYVKGESLRQKLEREGELPVTEAVRILKEVVDALAKSHAEGVVHRDIKPDNVLLSDRHALVTDFGVAKAVSEATGRQALTTAGVALGTPAYMAPEQAAAEKHIDHRADIYAVGALGYEMLTGRPPFVGSTSQAILAAHVTQPPEPVTHLRQTVPHPLAALVMKCLEKKPADRWQSTDEMLLQLEAVATPSGELTPTDTRPHAPGRPVSLRHPAALVGGALLALAVAWGLWQGLGGEMETTLDPNLVAVMPFRTAGADPSLGFLREGMMDLLANKLTGEGGPRAADPRTVLAALGRVTSADGSDLSEAQAADVARIIGAGQLLLGSVVGSPDHLVLSATLTSVGAAGPGTTQVAVEGPEDSLPVLLDRLTGELLAGGAGMQELHGASLTTSSLEALKEYLDGQAAFRGGHYQEASQHLSRALGVDSGFTLAAFALMRTAGWDATVTDLARVREIAWNGRNRLSPRDRTLLEAYMPRGNWENWADVLQARERAVGAMPDQADAWFLLGDAYFHGGTLVGFPDAGERAAQAFQRAVALDSTWVAPWYHLTQLATRGRDTSATRRLWQSMVRLDSISGGGDELRFMVGVALGDDEMRSDALDRLATQDWFVTFQTIPYSQTYGEARYLDTLTAIMRNRASTQEERNTVARVAYVVAMNRGRPRRASDLMSPLLPEDSDRRLLAAWYWNGLLEDTALVLRQADSTARAPFGPTAAEQHSQLVTACRLARWRLARGETTGVASLLQRLEAGLTMGDSVVPDGASPVCTGMVRAMLAVRQRRTDALPLVERVDSMLLSWPTRKDYVQRTTLMNLMVAGLFEELGDPERALAAIRRDSRPSFLSTKLREEGRLAALTGDREGAIRAYNHYLELRSDPEPGVLPEVEAVRDELARLVGEPESGR